MKRKYRVLRLVRIYNNVHIVLKEVDKTPPPRPVPRSWRIIISLEDYKNLDSPALEDILELTLTKKKRKEVRG